jgi:diguanylate cyclase (GGDEF)-like protein/PAS domain S-box-containing protein
MEGGIDPVRVRSLLHAVDEAVASIQAGTSFATVARRLHGTVSTLFPSSPDIERALLDGATNVLIVAAIQAGSGIGNQVMDHVLAQPGPVATGGECEDECDARIPGHIRALRRDVDADSALRALFATRAVGVCLTDLDGTVVKANDRYREILGIAESDAMGIRHKALVHDRFRFTGPQWAALDRHGNHDDRHLAFDGLVYRPDGTNAWIVADSTLIERVDGEPRYFLSLIEDVTAQRIATRAHGQCDERLLPVIQHGSDIFGIVNRLGRIEYVSRSVERVLGYAPDALHGTGLLDLAAPNDRATLALALESVLEQPWEPRRTGATLLHQDGTPRWMEIDLSNRVDVDGISGVVVSARDATTRKAAEEQLQRLAFFDSLTGLPNRVQFRERLDAALASRHDGGATGVIFIDLDRFKAINDRFGHDGGDTALAAVGERLMSAVPPGDLPARYGGEEFAILLNDTTPARAMRTAREVIQAVATAYTVHVASGTLSASAGVALLSTTLTTSRELLRAADAALYRSKARGGGIATLYRPEMDTWNDLPGAVSRAPAGTP